MANESFLTRDDHDRLARQLFELREALTSVQQDRSEAPVQAALEHAGRWIDALQARLTSDYLLSGWWPPPYWESSSTEGFAIAEIVPAAFEIDKLVNAKHPSHCTTLLAHHLWMAIAEIQELLDPGHAAEVIPPALHSALRQITDAHPLSETTAGSPTQAEYQQVAEHIAACGVYLQVLEQAAALPSSESAWERQASKEISLARLELLALLFAIRQQSLTSGSVIDHEKFYQVTDHLRGRDNIDVDGYLEALIPTARAMQAMLEGHATCDCLPKVARRVLERMEAIRGLAPRAQTH
jgi:hypothetical protein